MEYVPIRKGRKGPTHKQALAAKHVKYVEQLEINAQLTATNARIDRVENKVDKLVAKIDKVLPAIEHKSGEPDIYE